MSRILIIEDEEKISRFIELELSHEGYETDKAADGREGLAKAQNGNFDLIILDIMLPGYSGIEVLRRLRKSEGAAKDIPVILLTARDSISDKVTGLDMGANDYITKPFSPSELTARVDAVYRRVSISLDSKTTEKEEENLVAGPFKLDVKSRCIVKDNVPIELTQVEYQILEYFFRNRNTALDRKSILNHIWGDGYYGDDKIVDVNIRRIRMKIEDEPSNPKYLVTIWGFGYRWGDGTEN